MSINIDPKKVDFKRENKWLVQVGVSRAHVHLTKRHVERLFGVGYQLTVLRNLGQSGQFAAKETVNVVGRKGVLQQVRIIGPERAHTQVELSRTDTYTLGIDAPLRDSGSLENTPGAILIGTKGVVVLLHGCIVPRAHIHMLSKDAEKVEVADGEYVSILFKGEKTVCYHDVKVRLTKEGMTEFHIDTDEANAAFVETGDVAMIKHKEIIIKDNFGNVIEVNTDNIKFAVAKNADQPHTRAAIDLMRTVFDYPDAVAESITAKLRDPDSLEPNKYFLISAFEGENVIGIACFYWLSSVNMGYLEHIGISPEYQDRGIGSFFLNKVISHLEKNFPEIEGILLEVRQDREDLDDRKRFFLNNGAIPVDTEFYTQSIKLGQNILLMFRPETAGARLTSAAMELTLQILIRIL